MHFVCMRGEERVFVWETVKATGRTKILFEQYPVILFVYKGISNTLLYYYLW